MHGTGHKGKPPPVVSSLFSTKGRALGAMVSEARSWEQGARSGRRERRVIRVKGSASRGGESGVEQEQEHEHEQEDEDEDEDEDEGPNVYNCVSLSERQAEGALSLLRDFRSSILSYSILHTQYSMLNARCSMLNALCFVTTR